ncbi:hypothetical protein ACEN5Y_05080, partial [Streptococcus pyogenes]
MEAGSPPCSPQMPSFKSGLTERAKETANPFLIKGLERLLIKKYPCQRILPSIFLQHHRKS